MAKRTVRRLRVARMRNRATEPQRAHERREALAGLLAFQAPAVSDEQVAAWQQAWDEAVGDGAGWRAPIVLLPQQATWTPGPRKSPPRGLMRMREHAISLLINALRSDGTFESEVRVQTCKALRVLPWDVGFEHASRVTVPDTPGGWAAVEAAYYEDVIEPQVRALPRLMGLPDGIEFRFEPDTDPTDPNGATDS